MIFRNLTRILQEEEHTYQTLNKRISKTQKTSLILAGALGLALGATQCNSQEYQQPTAPGYNIILSDPCIKPHKQHIDITPCYHTNNDNS